jgi:hypothetical protein
MCRPTLELADVLRAQGGAALRALEPGLSAEQRAVVRAIVACRTAALGGHVDACDRCDYRKVSYNSCRNRHCPKCQGEARERWLDERRKDLLPVGYFHVVFTLPEQIAEIALRNKREVYAILFRAMWETVRCVSADPKHLGAHVGVLAVLHTWGQTLVHHPHLHCVIPAGGLSADGTRWVACRETYFLPVKVLSRLYRRRFLELLEQARARGRLRWVGTIAPLAEARAWRTLMAELRRAEWVVYAKRPFGGPDHVLEYLGRYTHKVAITNSRLLALEDGAVRFRYRDYRRGDIERAMSLEVGEFIRRFLQHVLPKGFQRIRQYGLLANCHRTEQLARCKRVLAASAPERLAAVAAEETAADTAQGEDRWTCPVCTKGRLRRVAEFEAGDPLGIGVATNCRAPPACARS